MSSASHGAIAGKSQGQDKRFSRSYTCPGESLSRKDAAECLAIPGGVQVDGKCENVLAVNQEARATWTLSWDLGPAIDGR